MNTTEQINAILDESTARAEKATKGPWAYYWGWNTVHTQDVIPKHGKRVVVADFCHLHMENRESTEIRDDMAFIAASRTELPARDVALRIAVGLSDTIESILFDSSGKYASEVERSLAVSEANSKGIAQILAALNAPNL